MSGYWGNDGSARTGIRRSLRAARERDRRLTIRHRWYAGGVATVLSGALIFTGLSPALANEAPAPTPSSTTESTDTGDAGKDAATPAPPSDETAAPEETTPTEEATPPAEIEAAIKRIQALLEGQPADLSMVDLDLADCPEFNRQVYAIARTIPPGATLTYGDIAKQLGGVELSRQVGTALGQNPCPIVVPCHRVLAAGGKPGGFSANGGVVTKLKMLAIEGAAVNYTPSLFD